MSDNSFWCCFHIGPDGQLHNEGDEEEQGPNSSNNEFLEKEFLSKISSILKPFQLTIKIQFKFGLMASRMLNMKKMHHSRQQIQEVTATNRKNCDAEIVPVAVAKQSIPII